jgi:hypothetical protein
MSLRSAHRRCSSGGGDADEFAVEWFERERRVGNGGDGDIGENSRVV